MSKLKFLILAIALLSGAIYWKTAPHSQSVDASPVLNIEPRPFDEVIEAEGHVDAERYHDIYAPFSRYERCLIYLIEEGASVKPGDLLAQFDPGTIETSIENLEDRIRSFDQVTTDIRFRSKAQTYEKQVQTDTAQQGVVLSDIRKKMNQYETLLKQTTAGTEYNNKLQELKSTGEQKKHLQHRDTVTERNRLIQKTYFEQKIKELKEDAEGLNIYAEAEGVVVYPPIPLQGDLRKVQTGDYLDRGQMFLRIPEPGNAVIRFHLEELQINRLREGMPTSYTLAAYPGEIFQGKILSIAHFSDQLSFAQRRRLYQVLANINKDEKKPPLKIGMVVHCRFYVHRFPKVYSFPKEWAKKDANGIYVFQFTNGAPRRLYLKNAVETADYFLVESIPEISGPVSIVMHQEPKETKP